MRHITEISCELDDSGLIWHPEIGDEVVQRVDLDRISILVDSWSLTPRELRKMFLWLPTVEQLVVQFEMREAMICHAGIGHNMVYEVVIKTHLGIIETSAQTLRLVFAQALLNILVEIQQSQLH